ncbi:MAG: PD-(D/E)XK nuclease family protein [Nitrosarchaeum sp.]|nr:PD-(D/E)XK nuclease family protein [Nitrosarchaeum sp.]
MMQSSLALTPTNMAAMAYCPRLFFINKTMPQHGFISNLPTVQGNVEHEAWRLLAEAFDVAWREWSPATTLSAISQDSINGTLSHVFNLSLENHPSHALDLKKYMQDLTYRLDLWLAIQEKNMLKLLHEGFSIDHIVSVMLPWKTEEKVFSNKFGLYGRVDAIYNDGIYIIPEDIKTHQSKFKTLLQKDSHKTQLLCYCIMLEENFDIPAPEARIFYTQDLSYETFKANVDEKIQLIEKITTARELIERAEIPPMLPKEDAAKCRHCYAREQCFKLAREQGEIEWIDRLLQGSDQRFDLFGGANHAN